MFIIKTVGKPLNSMGCASLKIIFHFIFITTERKSVEAGIAMGSHSRQAAQLLDISCAILRASLACTVYAMYPN